LQEQPEKMFAAAAALSLMAAASPALAESRHRTCTADMAVLHGGDVIAMFAQLPGRMIAIISGNSGRFCFA
jgi:hypothetical protein